MQVKLKVLAGKSAGKEIEIPVTRFLIGRSQECHLRPKSDAISRNHAAILVSDTGVAARDLNSRNGTYVNDERIQGDHPLSDGDRLRVGKLEFEVVIHQPEPVATAKPEAPIKATVDADSSNSREFDISEWLAEADAAAKASRDADPETRQYKLGEGDRAALDQAGQTEAAPEATDEEAEKKKGFQRPEKRPVGKLPERPSSAPANSREAAADMLKKMFNSR
jgi:predicted component of type VI protein secretion system